MAAATRWVALLRAVNVGKRRVEMARLRTVLESLGLGDVWTYINSGNAVFTSRLSATKLEPLIEQALADELGFEVETFVRSEAQIRETSGLQPFGTVPDGSTCLVAFLRSAPTKAQAKQIEALSGDVDQLQVHGSEVHWLVAGKSMDTELKAKHWKSVGAELSTTRNTTMLTKLVAKLDA